MNFSHIKGSALCFDVPLLVKLIKIQFLSQNLKAEYAICSANKCVCINEQK